MRKRKNNNNNSNNNNKVHSIPQQQQQEQQEHKNMISHMPPRDPLVNMSNNGSGDNITPFRNHNNNNSNIRMTNIRVNGGGGGNSNSNHHLNGDENVNHSQIQQPPPQQRHQQPSLSSSHSLNYPQESLMMDHNFARQQYDNTVNNNEEDEEEEDLDSDEEDEEEEEEYADEDEDDVDDDDGYHPHLVVHNGGGVADDHQHYYYSSLSQQQQQQQQQQQAYHQSRRPHQQQHHQVHPQQQQHLQHHHQVNGFPHPYPSARSQVISIDSPLQRMRSHSMTNPSPVSSPSSTTSSSSSSSSLSTPSPFASLSASNGSRDYFTRLNAASSASTSSPMHQQHHPHSQHSHSHATAHPHQHPQHHPHHRVPHHPQHAPFNNQHNIHLSNQQSRGHHSSLSSSTSSSSNISSSPLPSQSPYGSQPYPPRPHHAAYNILHVNSSGRPVHHAGGSVQQQSTSLNNIMMAHQNSVSSRGYMDTSPVPSSTLSNSSRYPLTAERVEQLLHRASSSPSMNRMVYSLNPIVELRWERIATRAFECPEPRGFHSLTSVGNKLYLVGGDRQTSFFDDVRVYNIDDRTWEKGTSLEHPRTGHTCVHYQNRLYVFGGKQPKTNGIDQETYWSDLQEYNLQAKVWTKVQVTLRGTKLPPRAAHSCDVIESQHKLFIFGGISPINDGAKSKAGFNYFNTVQVFDFTTREWTRPNCTGDTPPSRAGHSSCVVNDTIYIFGGRKGTIVLQDFYALDTRTFSWRKIYQRNPPETRAGHCMCYYPRGGVIILWGGGNCNGKFFDPVLTFDVLPSTKEWRQHKIVSQVKPKARFWHKMAIRGDTLYMFGGGNKEELFNDLFSLDLSPFVDRFNRKKIAMHTTSSSADLVSIHQGSHEHSGSSSNILSNVSRGIFDLPKVKVVLKGEMRVLKLEPNMNYNALLEKLRAEYKSNNVVIRYVDEDNDLVTIRSDDELRSAGEFFVEKNKVPRLEIDIPESTQNRRPMKSVKSRSNNPDDKTDNPKERVFNWIKGEKIGEGAYGTVYEAINSNTGEFMAAKYIRFGHIKNRVEREKALAEISREIELMKGMSHENIVRYLGVERHDNSLYIFLEYVPGGSLASLLKRVRRLSESTVRVYTKQILVGLKYLHDHKIVHRDIKGANILVHTTGAIKLADFGHSKVLETTDHSQSLLANKSVKGTPMWMAPEVILTAKHGTWSDIWSVGCVVVELMTGACPYPQFENLDALGVMYQIAQGEGVTPQIPAHATPECREFLTRIFQRDPANRATVEELLEMDFITQELQSEPNEEHVLDDSDNESSEGSDGEQKSNSELLSVDVSYISSDSYCSEDEEVERVIPPANIRSADMSYESYMSGQSGEEYEDEEEDDEYEDEDEEYEEEEESGSSEAFSPGSDAVDSLGTSMQSLSMSRSRQSSISGQPQPVSNLFYSYAPSTLMQNPMHLNQIRPTNFPQLPQAPRNLLNYGMMTPRNPGTYMGVPSAQVHRNVHPPAHPPVSNPTSQQEERTIRGIVQDLEEQRRQKVSYPRPN